MRAKRIEVSLSLMWVIANECAKLGLTVHVSLGSIIFTSLYRCLGDGC
ncbi:MAG: hypothetical protein WCS30_06875 [Selenomonadaceae bacterium]